MIYGYQFSKGEEGKQDLHANFEGIVVVMWFKVYGFLINHGLEILAN